MKDLFSLGKLYVSDFIKDENDIRCDKVEMKVVMDESIGAVRLSELAPLDAMYGKYWYRSGINDTMKRELKDIVDSILKVYKLKENDVWIDCACNDGTLLSCLPTNLTRIGIDPADDTYKAESSKHSDLIIQDYFTAKSYKNSKFGNQKAKIFTCIAMFYDLMNPDDFIKDVYEILDDNGMWVMQLSYTPLMIEQMAFDNFCHEHAYYYSLFNIKKLLERNGFKIADCQLNDVNGGSFRIYIMKENSNEKVFGTQPYRDVCDFRVKSILEYEKSLKLDEESTWLKYFDDINKLKKQTVDFIKAEKANGKVVWGYGACHDSKTRLITENGFKNFDEIEKTDKIYTLNPTTNQIEISTIDDIMIYDYDDDMVHFYGKRIDMLVTPNHNMLYQTYNNKNLKFKIADELMKNCHFALPKGEWVGKDTDKFLITDFVDQSTYSNKCRKIQNEFETSDFLYLLGLFIGDGYVKNQEGDLASAFCIPKQDKARQKLISTLNNMNLSFREYDAEIQVASQALRTIFLECEQGAKNKRIPKWALEYSPKYLRCLLDGLVDSDGWYEKNSRKKYVTTSINLAKDVVELCIKLGYFPSITTKNPPKKAPKIKGREIHCSIAYQINIGKSQPYCYNTNTKYPTLKEKYTGKVWCLSTNNKNFLVERNGKVAFSGNSTKGNTLLQYFELDNTLIDGIAERSKYKWGLKTIGTNIPICSEDEMRKAKPDYLLVLPWHFINEFVEREKEFLDGGGKFIVPCPKFEII